MSKELDALKERVCCKIVASGLKEFSRYYNRCVFIVGDEYHKDNMVNGLDLEMTEIHRSNGTQENVSVRLDIMEWENSSGHSLYTVKFSWKDSVKKQERLTDEIVNTYKEKIKGE